MQPPPITTYHLANKCPTCNSDLVAKWLPTTTPFVDGKWQVTCNNNDYQHPQQPYDGITNLQWYMDVVSF